MALNDEMAKLRETKRSSRFTVTPSALNTTMITQNQDQTIYGVMSDILNGAKTELSNVDSNLPITPVLDFDSLNSKPQSQLDQETFQQLAEYTSQVKKNIESDLTINQMNAIIKRLQEENLKKQKQGKQEGGEIETQPSMEEQADTQLDMAGLGPLGLVDDMDGERQTGVADDLPMELPEGSYVLNAHAVELIGVKDLNQIIKDAITIAVEAGYDLPKKVDPTKKVPIQISNGEFVIPEILVPIIGLENLEKMNRRGLEYRKQQEAEAGEKQQAANVQEAPVDAETQDLMDQIKDVA
jgi:hypothetical protein